MTCDCKCKICGGLSDVSHNCGVTPEDMLWCEGSTHPESKLIHFKCGVYGRDKYDEGKILCPDCAKVDLVTQ